MGWMLSLLSGLLDWICIRDIAHWISEKFEQIKHLLFGKKRKKELDERTRARAEAERDGS